MMNRFRINLLSLMKINHICIDYFKGDVGLDYQELYYSLILVTMDVIMRSFIILRVNLEFIHLFVL